MENTNPKNQNNEKFTMADCFITAMFLPKEYKKLLKQKTGRIVCYLLLLVFLAAFIQYAIPTLGAIAGMGGIKNIILNEIPEFSFENGELNVAEKIEKEESGVYFIVDTSVDQFTKDDVPADALEVILVGKRNVLVYNDVTGMGGVAQNMPFDLYKEMSFNNQTIADLSVWFYMGLFSLFVMMFVMLLIEYLISALFYGGFLYFITKPIMKDINFGIVYKIVLFAQSIGAIVAAVTYCIGTATFVMVGSIFRVVTTVVIMNKAIIHRKLEEMPH